MEPIEQMDKSKNRIQEIDKKIEILNKQRKAILNREKEQERKARTKRLIELGAVTEKYLYITNPKELEQFLKTINSIFKVDCISENILSSEEIDRIGKPLGNGECSMTADEIILLLSQTMASFRFKKIADDAEARNELIKKDAFERD